LIEKRCGHIVIHIGTDNPPHPPLHCSMNWRQEMSASMMFLDRVALTFFVALAATPLLAVAAGVAI